MTRGFLMIAWLPLVVLGEPFWNKINLFSRTVVDNTDLLVSFDKPHNGCKNHGLCKKPVKDVCSAADCVCNEGTSGEACATVDLKCSPDPCSALGPNFKCIEGTANYSCVCVDGWTGPNCNYDEFSPCAKSPCLNGGTCTVNNVTDSFSCQCNGHIGNKCQYVDPCVPSKCQNGGKCVPLWGGSSFSCECTPDYQGRTCQDTASNWTYTYEGCFGFEKSMKSHYVVEKDYAMTVEKCQNFARNKRYTMYMLAGENCLLSNTSNLNETDSYLPHSDGCNKKCPGGGGEKCGRSWDRVLWFKFDSNVIDPLDCRTSPSKNFCSEDADQGHCVDTLTSHGGHECVCKPPFQPPDCSTIVDPCQPDTCGNGTCRSYDEISVKCGCNEDIYVDEFCKHKSQCTPNPCLYGGTCVDNKNGTFSCECLQWYHGDNCESADICEYANPCFNGTCNPTNTTGVNVDYTCVCAGGFTGTHCDTETNECDSNPCKYESTCEDHHMNYTCTCVNGTTGRNCEINIPDCVPWGNYTNRCKVKDEHAVCDDLINGFRCNCSSQWTDEYCDMSVLIKNVLIMIYGDVENSRQLIPLLEDLLRNPARIKDMVPFMIGQKTYEERMNISWTAEDLFLWAAFEGKRLDLDDLTVRNDVVLGNCFTFNHRDVATVYKMRGSGKEGGFQALMNVSIDQYQPWFDTAAIMVFVHNPNENIFSESVRYNAEPGGQTELHVSDTRFTRLEPCVVDPSEVAAYYYEGIYTTDGCLRSCYQDMIQEACGCMDPRYPFPDEYSSCTVTNMPCVEKATDEKGDPSKWGDACVCPLPCKNQQYSVTWSRASYLTNLPKGVDPESWNSTTTNDTLLITVVLPVLNYKTYAEEQAIDLNRFISNLGGLLGVLMGVGIIWFIEVVFLIFHIGHILCSKS